MQLTDRQGRILRAVVEEHHASGRPVGSRTLVDLGVVDASPSTVRYELGRLEELGLIESPHTSAGRVPTDVGYRVYVDHLLEPGTAATSAPGALASLDAAAVGDSVARIDEALRVTTQALAEATQLLAVITSPRASGAAIRHVEILQLQPMLLVVVIISAAGDVHRRVIPTELPVDPGLVDWVGAYLAEEVVGLTVGHRLIRQRLRRPDLAPAERAMLALVSPAFDEFGDMDEQGPDVHIGGSAPLVASLGNDVERVASLVTMLDERRRLLDALRPISDVGIAATMSSARAVRVSIGGENTMPELQRLSVVGAAYGSGMRPLGVVSVIGPRSMDYTHAMCAVTLAAEQLGSVADELYGV
jgi:heat-inducible transcriptional repressor